MKRLLAFTNCDTPSKRKSFKIAGAWIGNFPFIVSVDSVDLEERHVWS